jgi:hypothetical protein
MADDSRDWARPGRWRLVTASALVLALLPVSGAATAADASGPFGPVHVTDLTTEHLADPLGIVPGR